ADLLAYYDGGIRIANTLLLPFAFPHDGKQPDNPGLLTQHDFTELPEFTATAPSKVVNEVKVKHRDAGADFKERLAIGSSVDNIEARRTSVKSSTVTLPGIIDPAQAAAWASRASASFSAGALEMSVTVRPPRAVNADDDALRAGDLVQITWDPLGINRLMRITRRRDAWAAGVDLDLESEHGFFGSLPPVEIARPPTLGESVPDPVVRARVFELDRQLLEAEAVKNAGAEDIFAAFLAMRPKSRRRNDATFEGQDVSGFQIWDSPDGSSYDPLGSQTYWAVRATLKTAVLPGDVATPINVNVDIDPANIDRERIVFQSESSRRNDTLLLVLDNEIFSIGAITLAQQNGMDWTLACLRARRGSAAAAHAAGAEAWLVYRDEITPHTHGDWEPGEQRFFKLQPSTPDETLDLEDAPVLKYTFAQAAAPLPVQITLGNLPSTARTMTELAITATVDAPSANLATVEVVLIRIQEGNAAQLQTSLGQWTMRGDGKAHWDVACAAIPIVAGNYRVEIRATVDSGQMTATASGVVVVTTGESGTGGSESLLGSYLNFRNSLSPVTLMPGDTEVYSAPLSIDLLGPNDKWLLVSWSIFVQCWGTNADITISLMPMLDGRYHATSFNFLAIREGRLAPENDRAITIHGETVVPIYWMDGLLGDAWAIEFRNDSDRNYHTGNDYAVKRYSVNISIKRWTGVPPT
ncbi:MAG: hypothetical protein LBK99_24675, partial [Opitutaceae bacterium]|nr:hypothetical protein [Opitutaceae bacterium]